MTIKNSISDRSTGRVALITGSSRGFGKQIAYTLSMSGFSVVVNYLSSTETANELVRELGLKSFAVKADVGDMQQVASMAALISDNYGRLDAVIHNAGITRDNLLLRQSEDQWEQIIAVNLKGCFNVLRTMTPLMIDSGGGHFVNISSYSGLKGTSGQAAYSASKAALLGLTYTAAAELGTHNIRVNAILPGYMMTEMGLRSEKPMERAEQNSVLHKLSNPAEAAEFVAWLLNTKNISGQVFSLDSRII
jgi:3-oxoacyl-[acyl-carrier protein] reductase